MTFIQAQKLFFHASNTLSRAKREFLVLLISLAVHEHIGHQVEVAAHGGLVDGEGARQFGGVPNLAVVVGDPVPKTPGGDGGDGHAQLRHVPFQRGLEELPPPRQLVGLGARCKGQ